MTPATDAANWRGAFFATLSMAAFTVNDALMTLAMAETGLFPAIFLRGLVATSLTALLAWRTGALSRPVAREDLRLVGLRAVGELGSTLAYLAALAAIGLTATMSIFQANPLAITLAAGLLLGERVGWLRAAAVVAGFAGVMLVVRPGTDAFDLRSLFALLAVGFVVWRDFTTRRLSADVPSMLVTLVTAVTITAGAGLACLFVEWSPPRAGVLVWLAVASVFLAAGYVFSVKTMRSGDLSFSAPFRYSALVWALAFDLALIGRVPDALTLAGTALIAAAGLATLLSARRSGGG